MADPRQALAGRRVLVTGAAGFLGRHLCRRLAECGAQVFALGRQPEPGDWTAGAWQRVDCEDLDALEHAFERAAPEVVYHLAGHADGRRGLEQVIPSLRGDLLTAVNLLTAATRRDCRRVVLGASFEEPEPDEREAVPTSPYAAAKWAAAGFARMFHALYGTPVVQVRIFMTYGPGQRAEKVIPYAIATLLRGETPRLASPGREVDWIYVDDTISGLLAAGSVAGIEGRRIDLGSGRSATVGDVVGRLAQLVGSPRPPQSVEGEGRGSEVTAVADAESAWQALGWRAATPLDEGLARTVAWHRALRIE